MMISRGRTVVRALSLALALTLPPISALAEKSGSTDGDKAMIVFDASGSMWGQIDGKPKIQIARETLQRVVKDLPKSLQLGMIAYGHNRKGDCRDIETLVDIGPAALTGQQLVQSVRKLNPKGKTPLSDAVKMAARKLRYTEDKATVILVTDGIETCSADPCALAKELEKSGIDFTAHVIGFGLSAQEGKQVACLAKNTGGLYLQADNADELAEALGKTVAAAPSVVPAKVPSPKVPAKKKPRHNFVGSLVLTEGGEPVSADATLGVAWFIQPLDAAGNPTGRPRNISRSQAVKWSGPAGRYRVRVNYLFDGTVTKDITLQTFETLDQKLVLNAARLNGIGAFMQDNFGVHATSLEWTIRKSATGKRRSFYADAVNLIVPAGQYTVSLGVRGEKADMKPTRTIDVQVGDVKQMDVILPHSEVTIQAVEADKTRNTKIHQRFSLRRADGAPGKMIKYIASGKRVFLRPGAYVVRVDIKDGTRRKPVSLPIDVGLGTRHTFTVPLP